VISMDQAAWLVEDYTVAWNADSPERSCGDELTRGVRKWKSVNGSKTFVHFVGRNELDFRAGRRLHSATIASV
jgi:hypothetical protein